MITRAHPGVIVAGRLYLGPVVQSSGAPVIDACGTISRTTDGREIPFGGIVITRRPTVSRGFVIGWRGALVPRPDRWRFMPRRLVRMRDVS